VGKNNNIIEINGKRYDARTGDILSHPHANQTKPKPTPSPTMKPSTKSSATSAASKPSMHDVVRQTPKTASRHAPKPSKTLMRHAVKKPSLTPQSKIKTQSPADLLAQKPMSDVVIKKSAKNLDTNKLAKASKVPQSGLITHFSSVTSDANSPVLATVASNPSPIKTMAASGAIKAKAPTTKELLERAVQQAKSHQEPAPKLKKRHKHSVRTTVASVTAIALIAFVGYQEMPNLKLNIASAKAGFSASLPSYQPAGYSLGKLSYSSGVVATKFTSNSDERNYTLTQKTSTWDSQALKDNFLSKRADDITVSETGGRTIFLYGKGNATWVNGGVWYIVQSGGSLTDRQLVELAKSI